MVSTAIPLFAVMIRSKAICGMRVGLSFISVSGNGERSARTCDSQR